MVAASGRPGISKRAVWLDLITSAFGIWMEMGLSAGSISTRGASMCASTVKKWPVVPLSAIAGVFVCWRERDFSGEESLLVQFAGGHTWFVCSSCGLLLLLESVVIFLCWSCSAFVVSAIFVQTKLVWIPPLLKNPS